MPLKMAGREIIMMLPFTDAMNMAMVVLDSAIHLYWTPFFSLTAVSPVKFSVS
jgi:hypothetical protein